MLLRGWLGPREGLDTAAWVLRILCVGYLLNVLPGPGGSIVLGKGLAQLPMWAGLISTSTNIAATITLYFAIGFYGIPIATVLGMGVSTAWFFWATRAELGVSLRELVVASVLWPALASLPGAAGGFAINTWLAAEPSQLVCLAGAVGALTWFGLSYALLLRVLPFLDAFDRHFLVHTLKLGRVPGFALAIGGVGGGRDGR